MTLKHAIDSLWRELPRPRPRRPVPQQSWANLKVGQYLTNLHQFQLQKVLVSARSTIRVVATTDQGATLEVMECGERLVWMDRDWKKHFERRRRPVGAPK